MWFRRDLRLDDNAALSAAVKASNGQVICLYILETVADGRALGGASEWWLDKSLRALGDDLKAIGGTLILRQGDAQYVLDQVISETGAKSVFWNRRYDAPGRAADTALKEHLKGNGIQAESSKQRARTERCSPSLGLKRPGPEITTKSTHLIGGPFKRTTTSPRTSPPQPSWFRKTSQQRHWRIGPYIRHAPIGRQDLTGNGSRVKPAPKRD